jgi:hypothetical protein
VWHDSVSEMHVVYLYSDNIRIYNTLARPALSYGSEA